MKSITNIISVKNNIICMQTNFLVSVSHTFKLEVVSKQTKEICILISIFPHNISELHAKKSTISMTKLYICESKTQIEYILATGAVYVDLSKAFALLVIVSFYENCQLIEWKI